MGVMERKEWGDTDEAGPATMTSRALNVGICLGIKMGWRWIGDVGRKAGPATMTSRAVGVSRWRGDDGKEVRRDLPQ